MVHIAMKLQSNHNHAKMRMIQISKIKFRINNCMQSRQMRINRSQMTNPSQMNNQQSQIKGNNIFKLIQIKIKHKIILIIRNLMKSINLKIVKINQISHKIITIIIKQIV